MINNIFGKILKKIDGNVAIMFAVAIMPVMLSIGAAVDYSRASNLHTKAAHATDAALLAAVSTVIAEEDINDEDAVRLRLNKEFEPFFLANMHGADNFIYNGYIINYDPVSKSASVDVDIDYETVVFAIVGTDSWDSDVFAATDVQMKSGGALSMFLVLDRSGSMGWNNGDGGTKMESLQVALASMITNLKKADPENKFIRMGAVAYSSRIWGLEPIKWELDETADYVSAMYASGGTDSSAAVRTARVHLVSPSEQNKHKNKSGQIPKLVMVFMTDGNNNRASDDTATIKSCNQAKSQNVEIYTVAFQAPEKGQKLLHSCASDKAHYFEPENTGQLIDAFRNIGTEVGEKLVLSR